MHRMSKEIVDEIVSAADSQSALARALGMKNQSTVGSWVAAGRIPWWRREAVAKALNGATLSKAAQDYLAETVGAE